MKPQLHIAELKIARATPVDASSILPLQRLAYESEARLYDDWPLPALLETLEQLTADIDVGTVLKAELSGELIGAVRGKGAGERCSVGRLIVRPDLQGRGVGRALMQQIEAEFADSRCFELFTGSRSERNIRLYQSLGYSQCRSQRISDKLTLVWMEKWCASA
jgi:ribosomal protein S18 acetylase RimI-like enzyme